MKPLSGLLVLLMIGSIIFNEIQPEEQAPIQENTYTFTIIDGNAIKANTTPTTPKIQVLASFSYDWDIYTEIAQYPLWDADLMTRIFMAESRLNSNAVNWKDRHRGCSGSFGIAQIGCIHFGKYGINENNWHIPEVNIAAAYQIFLNDGLNAWGAYTNKSYLRYSM